MKELPYQERNRVVGGVCPMVLIGIPSIVFCVSGYLAWKQYSEAEITFKGVCLSAAAGLFFTALTTLIKTAQE